MKLAKDKVSFKIRLAAFQASGGADTIILGHWDLPFDLAQGGELVEPFEIWFLVLGIFMISLKQLTFLNSVNYLMK